MLARLVVPARFALLRPLLLRNGHQRAKRPRVAIAAVVHVRPHDAPHRLFHAEHAPALVELGVVRRPRRQPFPLVGNKPTDTQPATIAGLCSPQAQRGRSSLARRSGMSLSFRGLA